MPSGQQAGVQRVITDASGTVSYIVSNDSGGSPVTLAGPFATAAEANRWLLTPAKQ